jgi:hypothetical protein
MNLCPISQQVGGEQGDFLMYAFSQLPSAQNSPYAKMAYFGVAYSGVPQWIYMVCFIVLIFFFLLKCLVILDICSCSFFCGRGK